MRTAPAEREVTTVPIMYGEVQSWYEERGEGEPLLLLHPGLVDSRALTATMDGLAGRFHVFAPDRRGHGRTPDVDGPISYELMAQDTIAFLDDAVGGPAHLLGCSDGATVALLVALRRPDLVRRLVVVAGVFHRDGWDPTALDADADPPEFLRQMYGEVSPDGVGHYDAVVAEVAAEHTRQPALTPEDLRSVRSRTLVMVGDDDEVRLEHAVEMYRALPDAELAVVPGTSHGPLVEKPELCNLLATTFLATEPVPTFAPIRRRIPDRSA